MHNKLKNSKKIIRLILPLYLGIKRSKKMLDNFDLKPTKVFDSKTNQNKKLFGGEYDV